MLGNIRRDAIVQYGGAAYRIYDFTMTADGFPAAVLFKDPGPAWTEKWAGSEEIVVPLTALI